MTVKFVNFFKSKIADVGGIGSGDTEFTLSAGDGAKMPTLTGGHHCYLVFVDVSSNREIVKVTAVVSDTCTIVRGQDGTTPRVFAQDDLVELRLTKGSLEDILGMTEINLSNTGLHIQDTDASHDLIIKPGSNLTADRILTVVTGNAARSLSIEADAVIDQDLTKDANPQFAGLNDGTYDIDIPTNAMAAAKFMLGNSNTIAWFYLNTAPPGWKVSAVGADTVMAVAGGAQAYNVNGGNPGGTWTQPNHTHTGPSHTHSVPRDGWGSNVSGITGRLKTWYTGELAATVNNTSGAGGTGATGGGAAAATYRPSASVGKLFQLDTV